MNIKFNDPASETLYIITRFSPRFFLYLIQAIPKEYLKLVPMRSFNININHVNFLVK